MASPSCLSPYPHGEVHFLENKTGPPSRAYLKLWELFTLLETAPKPGSFCLDMGGCPGGWTWVLASLGCKVLTVDKAELDPRVAAMPGVDYRMLSAFALDPRDVGVVDWFFCDVICYPDRLWRLVDRWRTFGKVRNFVCTVKFQGSTDHETAAKFWAYPGSKLVHLFNNKHELTWVLLDQDVDESAPAPGGNGAAALAPEIGGGSSGASKAATAGDDEWSGGVTDATQWDGAFEPAAESGMAVSPVASADAKALRAPGDADQHAPKAAMKPGSEEDNKDRAE